MTDAAAASGLDGASVFDAAIGLGSNVGDKQANIARAIALLTRQGDMHLVRRSRDYRSAPWGVMDQDWFVNAVITVTTALSAQDLLRRCQAVENEMGRVRDLKWGPRLIDVDILTYRDEMIDEAHLKVPHPFIAQRGFVLVPLQEIAPRQSIRGRALDDMIAAIDVSDIQPLP